MDIAQRIKDLRQKSGMTQVELAQKIKVSKQTMFKYENGIITNIPSDKIQALSEIFNVSPSFLMGWKEPQVDAFVVDDFEKILIEAYRGSDMKAAVCTLLKLKERKEGSDAD